MKTKAERVEINGDAQWVLINGRKPDAPVLLLIQQGPGFPMIHEAPLIERHLGLEASFRVVYWDQRGTGKSFSPGATGELTLDDLAADARAMIRFLCGRLGVARVHVLGLSQGGTVGLLAAADPSTPIASLVCVGPDVSFPEGERYAYTFALSEAERRGHRRALRQLRAIGAPPHRDAKQFMTRVTWISNFGGVRSGKTYLGLFFEALAALWASPHYSLREMIGTFRGMQATQARMLPTLIDFDLLARDLEVHAPVAIFQGRRDVAAPPPLAAALAERLGAELVEFANSAHNPHHEEPARCRAELLRFVSSHGPRGSGDDAQAHGLGDGVAGADHVELGLDARDVKLHRTL